MENVYEKFERELVIFCYQFAREVEKEINNCEFDREHGATRAAVINSALADLCGDMEKFPYARAVLSTAKDKASAEYKHLKEIYKD